jgi:hypothetical protein
MVAGKTCCSPARTRALIIRHGKARVDLAGIAPGKARHLCRNPLQLVGVGYDDLFYSIPEQPGKGKCRNGRLDEDLGVLCQRLEKLSQPQVVEIIGLYPLVLGTVYRRPLVPVTAGKLVGMRVNADKVHSEPPEKNCSVKLW